MEEVILVTKHDEPVGTMEKMEAHRQGLLHRAFSVFIFNQAGELLLQQRAIEKYHSGGLWTNACCSHPRPAETVEAAATRRLQEELGFTAPLNKAFTFVYLAPFENGLTEHEFDHVFVGQYSGIITPNPAEVMDYTYKSLDEISADILENPNHYTAWFNLAIPKLKSWLSTNIVL